MVIGMPITATRGPSKNDFGIPLGPELKIGPYFMDGSKVKNITVYTGQTAYLDCPVRNLGAKKVITITLITFNCLLNE